MLIHCPNYNLLIYETATALVRVVERWGDHSGVIKGTYTGIFSAETIANYWLKEERLHVRWSPPGYVFLVLSREYKGERYLLSVPKPHIFTYVKVLYEEQVGWIRTDQKEVRELRELC